MQSPGERPIRGREVIINAGAAIFPRQTTKLAAPRRRVLIVNVFADEYRRTRGSPHRLPRAMGPPYLAGAFAPDLWDIRLYNEQYSGLLTDTNLLGWPDMLVITGLSAAFDRMMQLTAYARTLNPRVVVAAGGPPVRALPRRARRIFDYACTGDIEQMRDVVRDAFGPDYAAEQIFPRYDLPYGSGFIGYAESSRNCNFRCSFCSLTAENRDYRTYDLDYVRRQILATGKKQICFLDNNFYGNDRDFFLAKVDLCKELVEAGTIEGWSCLVTGDFFSRSENLELASKAGCKVIFSGVESFDEATLRAYNKRQNTLVPQVEMIRNCLEAGIVFGYGVMLDPVTRPLADLRGEIEFIVDTPQITLPAYFTLVIPLLGTPHFRQCLDRGLILPNTRLRDLDGVTLTMHPLDPLDEVLAFVKNLPSLRGYRRRAIRHTMKFVRRYRGTLEPMQLYMAMLSALLICTESFASSPGRIEPGRPRQTYYGPTEALDPFYTPMIRADARYEDHFRPTLITDEAGRLHADVAEDLAQDPATPKPAFAEPGSPQHPPPSQRERNIA